MNKEMIGEKQVEPDPDELDEEALDQVHGGLSGSTRLRRKTDSAKTRGHILKGDPILDIDDDFMP